MSYLLAVLNRRDARFGAGLQRDPRWWTRIASGLPSAPYRDDGTRQLHADASCSAAVAFRLSAGERTSVTFLLAWHAPVWTGGRDQRDYHFEGTRKWRVMWNVPWFGSAAESSTSHYTAMYASRYASALEVARKVARDGERLFAGIVAWQSAVYRDERLPAWLRDSLVNSLALVAEDSLLAQSRPPLGDWSFPGGVFAMNESPRGCPQIACIPCDWYGTLPIVFFFPELARSTLRAFRHYQRLDGEIPFALGKMGDLPDLASPEYVHQVSLNGTCYAHLVDRLWRRTGDGAVLAEFYDSVRRCTEFTMRLSSQSAPAIRMPDRGGMEWFEYGEWAGMAAHLGGLRLAHLKVVERMAEAMHDAAFAERCRGWFEEGRRAMEERLWTGSCYRNFVEPETGRRSDAVMAYQLDGQWASLFQGVGRVFPADRARIALETIRRCNVALTPKIGAANFAEPDGSALDDSSKVAAYGRFSMFPSELLILAMTCLYEGEREFGLELAERHWRNLVIEQRHPWDLPNLVRGDTGVRTYGTDYYQNLLLWAVPAAIEGIDLETACRPGGLIASIIEAAADRRGAFE